MEPKADVTIIIETTSVPRAIFSFQLEYLHNKHPGGRLGRNDP